MKEIKIKSIADAFSSAPSKKRPWNGYTGIKVTWKQLVEIEPRLADPLKHAEAVEDEGKLWFCANDIWYGQSKKYPNFRAEVYRLVGWEAEKTDPILNTPEAFDKAYRTIYEALPPCRSCMCL